jgi:hypothetical protein
MGNYQASFGSGGDICCYKMGVGDDLVQDMDTEPSDL